MNAVIYARYSLDNQREESIDGQLREHRVYAERMIFRLSAPIKIDAMQVFSLHRVFFQ